MTICMISIHSFPYYLFIFIPIHGNLAIVAYFDVDHTNTTDFEKCMEISLNLPFTLVASHHNTDTNRIEPNRTEHSTDTATRL